MKLEWLRAFSAVMRSGTVTGASSIILRTQPQVSRMVGALEQQLGLKLFRREGRRLVPTPEALEFNQFIDPVLRSLDNLDNVATDISKKRSRHIAIAAEPFLLHVLVPEAISRAATRDDGHNRNSGLLVFTAGLQAVGLLLTIAGAIELHRLHEHGLAFGTFDVPGGGPSSAGDK